MQDLSGKDVFDIVVRLPKTLSAATSVAEARAAFDDDHVHMLLITDDEGRLLGTLLRADLAEADDDGPAVASAQLQDRTFPPDLPAEQAFLRLVGRDERRRAVVDEEGRLLGLLALKRRRHGFCSDADVAARAADPEGRATAEASP